MNKQERRERRTKRARAKLANTSTLPRLSVYRSNNHVYIQLIDDVNHKTILGLSEKHLNLEKEKKITKTLRAHALGKLAAQEAIKKDVKKAVFDRGGYGYHGIVKAVADGAREGGLQI